MMRNVAAGSAAELANAIVKASDASEIAPRVRRMDRPRTIVRARLSDAKRIPASCPSMFRRMPELRSYLRHQLPPVLAAQVRAFQRIQWPFLDQRSEVLWDFTPRPDAPVHFVMTEGDVLISHVCVNRRRVEVRGQPLEVFGLSSVFTYPAWRGEGHAGQLVEAATDYLRASPADVAMLFCGGALEGFYSKRGWSP